MVHRRSLLTQEGVCLTLQPDFHFLEVAYPYIARRLLTDEDPALRERLFQVSQSRQACFELPNQSSLHAGYSIGLLISVAD